jgi:hypothetical protein
VRVITLHGAKVLRASDPTPATATAASDDVRPPCIRKSDEVQGELLDRIGVVQATHGAKRGLAARPP